jgi:[acyl-carrier-protein] S-malonyltransferase
MGGRALVFAGQGAQFVGMGKDLAESFPDCKALFDKADDVLGYSLSSICFDGPSEELTRSNHCQPAIFVTSVACYTALKARVPDLTYEGVAGLSLGEWSALHVAGALSFEDTLRVLEARGRFMQEACEERDGAMVSVMGLSRDQLDSICSEAGVEIGNLNNESQTVLSGERAAILKAEELANAAGAKRTVVLNVAGAFHSTLMNSAAERLQAVLEDVAFSQPRVPVVANVTGVPHVDADSIRRDMVKQVTCSVRWLDCIQWFQSNGITDYIECGPGKVLSGLIKRIDRGANICNVQDISTLDSVAAAQ